MGGNTYLEMWGSENREDFLKDCIKNKWMRLRI
jgi:hypothetical protein